MDSLLRFFRHYGLSICVALTILYVCMMPSSNTPDVDVPFMDKLVHACMYLALSFCISLNLYQEYTEFNSTSMLVWAVVVPILYGGLIEIMQGELTLTRSCDLYDFIADATGAIVGYFFARWFVPRHFKQNEN